MDQRALNELALYEAFRLRVPLAGGYHVLFLVFLGVYEMVQMILPIVLFSSSS